jgi:hypothetical protein
MIKKKTGMTMILARFFIGVVTFLNLQAAVQFMVSPHRFAPGFELSGIPGEAMIQGMGLLFLMWNIPYLVALFHPLRHLTSLIEAVIMQAIGVFGETFLLLSLKGSHDIIRESVRRFIYFDSSGLVLLLIALALVLSLKRKTKVVGI